MALIKSRKFQMFLYVMLTVIGLVVAFGPFVPNEYVKFVIALVSLCVGAFGFFNLLGQSGN